VRVFVADYESLCALGAGKREIWEALASGLRGGKAIHHFPTEGLPNRAGAFVEAEKLVFEKTFKDPASVGAAVKRDRKLHLGLRSLELLLANAGTSRFLEQSSKRRGGFFWGLGIHVPAVELSLQYPTLQTHLDWVKAERADASEVNANLIQPCELIGEILSSEWGLSLPMGVLLTACSSSAQSLGTAYESIRTGRLDYAIAGGADSLLNLLGYLAFAKMGVIPESQEDPATQCRPLDESRIGTLLGEGGTAFVLVSEEMLQKAGLTPRAEVIGYGSSLDAFKITAPDPEGRGMELAMRRALNSAGIATSEVDYINLHGTGTTANDPVEVDAVARVFGRAVAVSSTKDRHGHLIAGAGACEAAICCLALEHGSVPGTLNMKRPIDSKGLDFVSGTLRKISPRIVMSNSFAFGGINASLLLKKTET
jgi:3-oxoacyl-[acyl-carrier-protein] synthase II